jgi:hypothetical protein
MRGMKAIMALACCLITAWAMSGCATSVTEPARKARLQVIPDKVVIGPQLLKEPVKFSGSGFGSKEMVVVEMVVPPEVEMKGVKKGEDVGLAYGTCDEAGNFEAAMAPTATLNWFFRTEWSPTLAPDLKQAKPLPPARYEIRATGLDSGAVGQAYLEVVSAPSPAPKK